MSPLSVVPETDENGDAQHEIGRRKPTNTASGPTYIDHSGNARSSHAGGGGGFTTDARHELGDARHEIGDVRHEISPVPSRSEDVR